MFSISLALEWHLSVEIPSRVLSNFHSLPVPLRSPNPAAKATISAHKLEHCLIWSGM